MTTEEQYNKTIPLDAKFIIEALETEGYEAYIVGGCVRDLIMGRTPNDWDITTSATPEQVKSVFKRTYDTGIAHGTVTVIINTAHYEVTTYRIEGEYKDCRHPDAVSFVEDITLDLSRRDFTMNAIAYHPTRGFVDPYNGQAAIKEQCIRSVRDAKERFTEDALRILRGVRFAAQLAFRIDDNTIEGIKACRGLLANISKERIRDEFLKICLSDSPDFIETLYTLDLMPYILPEFEAMATHQLVANKTDQTLAKQTLKAIRISPKQQTLRLALLLHGIAKPCYDNRSAYTGFEIKGEEMTKTILKALRMDNQTLHDVSKLVRYQILPDAEILDKYVVKTYLNALGEPLFDTLCEMMYCIGQAGDDETQAHTTAVTHKMRALKQSVVAANECYALKSLAINGQDLIKHGMAKGKGIGEKLGVALDYVMHHPEANTKEHILAYLNTQHTTDQ